jgi:hypothetical protein
MQMLVCVVDSKRMTCKTESVSNATMHFALHSKVEHHQVEKNEV